MKSVSHRIPSLDGLRTVSIVLVVIGHVFHTVGLGDLGNLGNLGVRVFFVISGFLITGLLLREIETTSTINLLKFYFRRTLRIFPPYYFYLLVMLAIGLAGLVAIPISSIFFASIYVTDYINPSNWYLGHTWSLAVEEQFYLLLPGVLLILGVKRSKYFLIALILILPFARVLDFHISGPDQMWVLKGFHANMDALAIGCLLTLFREAIHRSGAYQAFLRSRLIILLPVVILFFNFQYGHPNIFYGVSITVMNIMIALCLDWSVTNHASAVGKLLNSRSMIAIGAMSYSIYLWQQPFFNPDNPSLFTRFPVNFIGLGVMSLFSYYIVERYSLGLRQRWEAKFFAPKGPVLAEPLGYVGAAN